MPRIRKFGHKTKKRSNERNKSNAVSVKDEWRETTPKEEFITFEPVSADEAWISCQSDVNKLVKRNGFSGLTDPESPRPEKTSDVDNNHENITQVQTSNIIIDEVFHVNLNTDNSDNDENDYNSPSDQVTQSEEWVIEQQLCRCCHVEGDNFLSLQDMDQLEGGSYEDMLATCAGVQLLCVEAVALRALCGLCAARLRDAYAFGRQVRACEERFNTLYNSNIVRVAGNIGHVVKEEATVAQDADDSHCYEDLAEEIDEKINENPSYALLEEISKEIEVPKKQKKATPKKQKESKPHKKKERLRAPRKVFYEYCKKVGDKYECLRCKSQFSTKSYCKRHYNKMHLKIPTIRCDHCRERFNTNQDLAEHKLKYNIPATFQCNACDRLFNNPKQLKSHTLSYHMLGEKVSCAMCDYECYSKIALAQHMDKHKTVKDFHCKYCKKSFLRQRTLALHERIHTGDKRKKCQECGLAFVQKASLNYHMAKSHPEVKF